MNPAATSRMQLLARAGLALAACLLLLPTPGHAVTLNVTDDAFIRLTNTGKNFGSRKSVKVDGPNGLEGFAKFDLSVLGGATASDIDAANLRLWITKVKVAGSIEIRRVLGAWDEDTLTGDTALADFSLGPLIVPIASSDQGSFVLVRFNVLGEGLGWRHTQRWDYPPTGRGHPGYHRRQGGQEDQPSDGD